MKKFLSLILALFFLSTAAAALANDFSTDFGNYYFQFGGPVKAPTIVNTDPSQSVDITIWSDPNWEFTTEDGVKYDQEGFFKETWARFAASYPGAKINSINTLTYPGSERDEKISVAMNTNTLPDLMFGSFFSVGSRTYDGLYVPVDDIITEEHRGDIDEAIWDLVTVNGNVYGLPWAQGLGFLAYNADMFRKAGLDDYIGPEYGFANWKPADYLNICQTLHEKLGSGIIPTHLWCKGTDGDTWNVLALRMYGAKWWSEDGKVILNTEESAVKALQFMKDLFVLGLTNGDPSTIKSSEARANLLNQLAAIGPMQQSSLKKSLNAFNDGSSTPFDLRIAYIPSEEQPQVFSYVYCFLVIDTQDATRIQVVKDYLSWLIADENLSKEAARIGFVRNSDIASGIDTCEWNEAYSDSMKYAVNFNNNTISYTQLRNALYPQLQAVYAGDKTPQEALDAYASEANAIIEEAQKNSIFN